jgi:glucan phosphoethanolaminetransferase (alkaline phosphatase superfamily)
MLADIIGELIFRILLVLPGALVRWLIGRCRKSFFSYLDDEGSNMGITVLIIIVIVLLRYFIYDSLVRYWPFGF